MKAEWEARLKDDRQIVGEEEIANVVSMMSGVPVQRMAQAEIDFPRSVAIFLKTSTVCMFRSNFSP